MLETKRFLARDEEFICENCGKKVSKLGYSSIEQKVAVEI